MRKMFLLLSSIMMVGGAFAVNSPVNNLVSDGYAFSAQATISEYISVNVTGTGFAWADTDTAALATGWKAAVAPIVFDAKSNVPLTWTLDDGTGTLSNTAGDKMNLRYWEAGDGNLATVGNLAYHVASPHIGASVLRGDGTLTINAELERKGTLDAPGSYSNTAGSVGVSGAYFVSITKM